METFETIEENDVTIIKIITLNSDEDWKSLIKKCEGLDTKKIIVNLNQTENCPSKEILFALSLMAEQENRRCVIYNISDKLQTRLFEIIGIYSLNIFNQEETLESAKEKLKQ